MRRTLIAQLGAVVAALALGGLLVLLTGYNPLTIYAVLLDGSLGGAENVCYTLQYATPLVFTGLAAALAFRAGIFNIGAEGQLVMGGLGAALAGVYVPALLFRVVPSLEAISTAPWASLSAGGCAARLVAGVLVVTCVLAVAALFGAAWGAVPGYLRATIGVSEVIVTIMANFLASLFVSYLLTGPFKEGGGVPQSPAIPPLGRLPALASIAPSGLAAWMGATKLNLGFLLAIAAAVAMWYLLSRTTLGFEFLALGANPEAARAQGIPTRRRIVQAMAISGALAGLGGAEQVLGVFGHCLKDFWVGLGFTGIAVALLARNDPLGVLAAAFLFGALQNAAIEIDMMTSFPRELIIVLQALIIFCTAATPALLRHWESHRRMAASTPVVPPAPPAAPVGAGGPA